jgi:hypothetical protein
VTLHLTSIATGGDTIALAGAGTLVVTAGYGDTAAEAVSEPAVRQLLHFRVVDGEIEVLLPTAAQRLEVVDDVPQWRRAVANPELTVTVSSAPLGP